MRTLALAFLSALAAAAAAGAATGPIVPAHSQRAIVRKLPSLAYVPTRVPTGFRYDRWAATTRPALAISLRDKAGRRLTFVAARQRGRCDAGREKTFQLDGNKVYWSETANGQQAWRCVTAPGGRVVRLTVSTALPPTRFSDSGLGRVAASGRRIHL